MCTWHLKISCTRCSLCEFKFIILKIQTNLISIINYSENDDEEQSIPSMPGILRYGVNRLIVHLSDVVKKGLKSVLLFGVIENLPKVYIFAILIS